MTAKPAPSGHKWTGPGAEKRLLNDENRRPYHKPTLVDE
jgi:hypothetical protein